MSEFEKELVSKYLHLMSIFYPETSFKEEWLNCSGFVSYIETYELPYRVKNWYRIYTKKELKDMFGEYYNFSDYRFPSPKFYKNTLKYEPELCKEIDGVKWVHSIDMETPGVRQFY